MIADSDQLPQISVSTNPAGISVKINNKKNKERKSDDRKYRK